LVRSLVFHQQTNCKKFGRRQNRRNIKHCDPKKQIYKRLKDENLLKEDHRIFRLLKTHLTVNWETGNFRHVMVCTYVIKRTNFHLSKDTFVVSF